MLNSLPLHVDQFVPKDLTEGDSKPVTASSQLLTSLASTHWQEWSYSVAAVDGLLCFLKRSAMSGECDMQNSCCQFLLLEGGQANWLGVSCISMVFGADEMAPTENGLIVQCCLVSVPVATPLHGLPVA